MAVVRNSELGKLIAVWIYITELRNYWNTIPTCLNTEIKVFVGKGASWVISRNYFFSFKFTSFSFTGHAVIVTRGTNAVMLLKFLLVPILRSEHPDLYLCSIWFESPQSNFLSKLRCSGIRPVLHHGFLLAHNLQLTSRSIDSAVTVSLDNKNRTFFFI
jgi:hypothetical protein